MVKRLVSLGAAVCILFSFLCIPAGAVDSLSGTVRDEFYVSDNFTSWSTRPFDLNYPTSSQYTTITNGDWDYGSLHNFLFNLGPLSSNTVISLSYYFTCKYPAEVTNSTAGVSGVYLDVNGGSHAFVPSVGTFPLILLLVMVCRLLPNSMSRLPRLNLLSPIRLLFNVFFLITKPIMLKLAMLKKLLGLKLQVCK